MVGNLLLKLTGSAPAFYCIAIQNFQVNNFVGSFKNQNCGKTKKSGQQTLRGDIFDMWGEGREGIECVEKYKTNNLTNNLPQSLLEIIC